MRWQYFQKLGDKAIFSKVGWRDNIFLTLSFAIAGSAFARLIFRFLNSLPYLPLTPGCVLHKYDQLGCPSKFFPQLLSGWRAQIFFSWMQENSVKDPACLKESFSRHVSGTQRKENNGGNVFGQRGSREARRTSLTAPTFGRCSHNNRSDAWIPICSRKEDMRTIDICWLQPPLGQHIRKKGNFHFLNRTFHFSLGYCWYESGQNSVHLTRVHSVRSLMTFSQLLT